MSLIIYRLSEKRNWLEIKRFRNGDFHTWLKWKLFDGVNGWKLSHMHSDIHVCQKLCRTVTVQINLHQSINQSAGVSTTIFCVFMITWKRDSIEKNESSSSLVSFYLSRLLFFFEFIFFFLTQGRHNDDHFILNHNCHLHLEICPIASNLSISGCKYIIFSICCKSIKIVFWDNYPTYNWHSEVTWPDNGEDGSKVGKPLFPGVPQYIYNSTKRHLIRSWRPLSPRKKKYHTPFQAFQKARGVCHYSCMKRKKINLLGIFLNM